ncbi:hypothetical protein [Bacillus safensis]|uniref:Uncharacterized protein n=1 Tax=Bacillus safensis TaxID=561879 RepID=A0A1L6ZPB9_BACIA|nr:hypothetical protein [Bacillus safensis]APT48360.1 hypothetical protein BSA145_21080 [Bacillus safensis]
MSPNELNSLYESMPDVDPHDFLSNDVWQESSEELKKDQLKEYQSINQVENNKKENNAIDELEYNESKLIPILKKEAVKDFLNNSRLFQGEKVESIVFDGETNTYSSNNNLIMKPDFYNENNDYEMYKVVDANENTLVTIHKSTLEKDENIAFFQMDRNFYENQGFIVDNKLEELTIKNLANESVHQAHNYIQEKSQKEETSISTDEIKTLLMDHMQKVEEVVNSYINKENEEKNKTSFKDRINNIKTEIKDIYSEFKNNVNLKIQAIKNAPSNLKRNVQNKIIDGAVSVNEGIVKKINSATSKIEAKRPLENQKNTGNNILEEYKKEYRKHLLSNFKGEYSENVANKIIINDIDNQLTNKPELAVRLRHEAITEMHKDFLEGNLSSDVDAKKMDIYLNDKSEFLSHGIRHFEKFQLKELLKEDLKDVKYQISEQQIEATNEKKSNEKSNEKTGDLKEREQQKVIDTDQDNKQKEIEKTEEQIELE